MTGKPKRPTKREREAKRAEEDSAIRETAFREGYAAGNSDGWKKGYRDGKEAGANMKAQESWSFGWVLGSFILGVLLGQR